MKGQCWLFADMTAKKKPGRKPIELNTEDEITKLAARIKKLRVAAGYPSYELFAYDHGFSRTQFGRYEQGKDLRFTSLVRVASAFGMTLPEFFAEGF
jgi:hypothetical protein